MANPQSFPIPPIPPGSNWVMPVDDSFLDAPAEPTPSLFDPTRNSFDPGDDVFLASAGFSPLTPTEDGEIGAAGSIGDAGEPGAAGDGSAGGFGLGPSAPSENTGYQTVLEQGTIISIEASNYNQIGQSLGATPGAMGALNAQIMQADSTLVADALDGTVSQANLSMFAASPWHDLEFTNQNNLHVTEHDAVGTQWDFNAPTPFAIPTASAFGLAKFTETPADWNNVINSAIRLGPILAGTNTPTPAAFATAAEFEPVGSAARNSWVKLAADISYGATMTSSGPAAGLTFGHWGATPY